MLRIGLVPRAFLLLLLRAYKVTLSPLFAGSCRFLPTCADYAADAVRAHGATRGSWLAVQRLCRCHPLAAAGLDPVPPARLRTSIPGSPSA